MNSRPPLGPFAAAVAAYEAGRFADAESACRNLLAINASHADALHLLALSLSAQGSSDAAETLRRALAVRKKDPGLWLALGNAEARAGNKSAAADAYRTALRSAPGYIPAFISLGQLHFEDGRYAEAATSLKRGLELDDEGVFGRDADLWNKLGYALSRQGRISDAAETYRHALSLNPPNVGAQANLAMALLERGEVPEAVAAYEKALTLAPKLADLHSNMLLALNYSADHSPDTIFQRHRAWGEEHGQVARLTIPRLAAADGRLRIGYVSADLRSHPVAQFLLPLLTAHRRDQVSVTCYSNTAQPDAVTERLRAQTDAWRDIRALSDDEAARAIAIDGIDVLIDLGGHTANNRLGVFARKPAPLQATWLGYPNTTGLSAIDLRITDAIADPPGEADHRHSETLLRLPQFLCYGAPGDAPAVTPLPALTNGFVTFGSFNNSMKVTPATVALWAELLESVPHARLVLKSPLFTDEGIRARYESLFTARGIERTRLELLSAVPEARDHLALYGRVDIALDSLPYNGTTTTCEALWMGCPVVTLLGDRHAGRVGASLLNATGLSGLVTANGAEYKAKAMELASDLYRLAALRQGLRAQIASSPLCGAAAFATAFEDALRAALAAHERRV